MKKKFQSFDEGTDHKWKMVQNHSFKGATISNENQILRFKEQLKEKFIFKVLEEELFTIYVGMAFEPAHFLYKPFNEIVLRAVQSGLIEFWTPGQKDPVYKIDTSHHEPVVLAWNHVYVGFHICLVCFAVSIACFISEILYYRICLMTRLSKSRK